MLKRKVSISRLFLLLKKEGFTTLLTRVKKIRLKKKLLGYMFEVLK